MSGPLQLTKFSDEYRDAWERAVRENPACGFMQSLTWAELQARQGVEVYPRVWFRDGRIEGGAIFQAARSLDGPGILVTPGGPIGPPVLHRFLGGGLTGYLLLSESHIAFHTYSEHRYIALDIFSCGCGDSKAALSVFLAALEPGRERITTAPRGAEIPYRD